MKKDQLVVKNIPISFFSQSDDDYISLTDIARFKDEKRSDYIIQNWLRNRATIEFLGLWEKINNLNFKSIEFDGLKHQSGLNSFSLTPKRWIEQTKAIGLISKKGKYGGTYAHKDIAFEFASWISAEFKLYLIKEFQRLKTSEQYLLKEEWNVKRFLVKANYKVHTDAVKENLVPQHISKKQANFVYASEADILNVALFGMTAKQWRECNPDKKGNIRDYANIIQLVCMAGLESLNAEFIRQKLSQQDRLIKLNQIAVIQMKSLVEDKNDRKLLKSHAN